MIHYTVGRVASLYISIIERLSADSAGITLLYLHAIIFLDPNPVAFPKIMRPYLFRSSLEYGFTGFLSALPVFPHIFALLRIRARSH